MCLYSYSRSGRKVRVIPVVVEYMHWMDDQGKEVKVTKDYSYDCDDILQRTRTTWSDIIGDGDLIKVQKYGNGLAKVDTTGNSFIYKYKKG